MHQSYDVCVVGLGPVGAVSAACYAKQGFHVLGIDIDSSRVSAIASGKSPFAEPGLNDLIREVRKSDRLQASRHPEQISLADLIVIAVGTPTEGEPDLVQLDKVAAQIGQSIKGKDSTTIIVVRSTVPPGTIRHRLTGIIESISGKRAGEHFHMASNPEFLREGTAITDFFRTGRIIIGTDSEHAADRIESLYTEVDANMRLRVSIEAAEFAKYVDNTWHALKVSFANEIGRICQAFGGNVQETSELFLSDDRLNISTTYLRPGFAFGGSCLPKDVRGLAWLASQFQIEAPVVNAIIPSNQNHIAFGLEAILAETPQQVGILGMAFKEHVDDLRESPSMAIAAALMQRGISVSAHDPAYAPGEKLAVPGTEQILSILELDTLAYSVDTLVLMHRLPLYYAAAARHSSKRIVDLTQFPIPGGHGEKKTFKSAKSAA